MKKTLFFILFILNFNLVFSQTKIDFDSKYLFTTKNLGPDIKILTDSVVFKHENSIMFCDSALFNYETNYFDAFGNVRLIKPGKNLEDTVFLYGDTLHYSGQDKYAKVRNHVILKKDSLLLETNNSNYVSYLSGDAHPAVLFEGVKLRLSIIISNQFAGELNAKLYTTKYLKWYSEERQTLFNSKVSFKDSTEFIETTFSKIFTKTDGRIINKLSMFKRGIPTKISNLKTKSIVYYHNAPVFFIRRRSPSSIGVKILGAIPFSVLVNTSPLSHRLPVITAFILPPVRFKAGSISW